MKTKIKLVIIPLLALMYCFALTYDSFAGSSSSSSSSSSPGSKSSFSSGSSSSGSSSGYKSSSSSSSGSSSGYKSSGSSDGYKSSTQATNTGKSSLSTSQHTDKSSNPGYITSGAAQQKDQALKGSSETDRHNKGVYGSSTGQSASGARIDDTAKTGKSSFSSNVDNAAVKKQSTDAYKDAKYTPKVISNPVNDSASTQIGRDIYSQSRTGGYTPPRTYTEYRTYRNDYYTRVQYNPPVYVIHSHYTEFGSWDSRALWYMFDNMAMNAAFAAFFHNHVNDPGVMAWKKEALKTAEENGELKEKLRTYETELAKLNGTPVNPKYVPTGMDPSILLAQSVVKKDLKDDDNDGCGFFCVSWYIIKILIILVILLVIGMWIVKRYKRNKRI